MDDRDAALITAWHDAFDEEPVGAREVANASYDNAVLRAALAGALPGFTDHPHPALITRWLSRRENLPLHPDGLDRRYRFSRVGHRWRLIPLVDPALAATS